ncbi:SVEP1-like protein, partial [Mya arenaria]
CLAGNARDPESLTCRACEIGTHQELSEQLHCTDCPNGQTTANTGSVDETFCTDECAAGFFESNNVCERCDFNTYKPEGETSCVACPAERPITTFQGATSEDDCRRNVCGVAMDLVLIVDCTASIGVNFPLLKIFLINQLHKFNIGLGTDQTRISLLCIGEETTPQDTKTLTQSVDAEFIRNAIMALKGGAIKTNTADAIRVGTKIMEEESTDKDKAKVMMVITDGRSLSYFQTQYESLLAKQKGFIMMAVGIGSNSHESELAAIASEATATEWTPLDDITITPCDVAMDLMIGVSNDKVKMGILSFGAEIYEDGLQGLTGNDGTIRNAMWAQYMQTKAGTVTGQALVRASTLLQADSREAIDAV